MARPVRFRDRWRIRWLDEFGKRQSEVFTDYREALSALRSQEGQAEKARGEMRAGLRSKDTALEHTFDDLAAYWLERRAIPSRRKHIEVDRSIIRRHLQPAFAGISLATLGVEHVDRFVATRGHLSKKTIHNLLTLLIAMLNVGVELGWLTKAPKIRKPRVPLFERDFKYFRTEDEVRRFLRAAAEEGPLAFAIYATAVWTGLRAGELAGLLWDDVDLTRRLITVQRSYRGSTKSEMVRHVPVLDPLLPILREWRLRCPGDIVFPNERGTMNQPSARIFQEVFRRTILRGGFPKGYVTMHSTRHTFASFWMMRGGDLFRLQKILGHSTVQMTMRYSHLAPDAFSSDYGRLSSLAPTEPASVVRLGSGSG